MSLKKLLWNDKATELFGHCRDQSERAAPERPEEDIASHRSHTARKVLKGSAAFTTALLFGNGESQGLIRTFGQASAEAGKSVLSALAKGNEESSCPITRGGYREGPDGYGYYSPGSTTKLHD